MKKNYNFKLFTIVFLTVFIMTGCKDRLKSAEELYSSYTEEMGVSSNSSKSESKAEEQIPSVGKCEEILEQWCRSYYNESFNGMGYKMNSLSDVEIVDINYNGTKIQLKGRHSFEGLVGENHNDLEFHANIYCKGDNAYEVMFERKRAMGGWQSATRTVYL